MIEWHHRYFTPTESQRVVSGMRLANGTTGSSAVMHWAIHTQAGLDRASKACGLRDGGGAPLTRVMQIDDESFMFDLQPWPDRVSGMPCGDGASDTADGGDAGSRRKPDLARRCSCTRARECACTAAPRAGTPAAAVKKTGSGDGLLARPLRFWVAVRDEFEDEQLLWFFYAMCAFLACACACCCWTCISVFREKDDEDSDPY